jgi:O-succinylbenzoic acid--CoA ligase
VALLGWNSTAYAAVVHAAARVGAVLLPLNARLSPEEMAWQLVDARATHLVYDPAHLTPAFALRERVADLTLVSMNEPLSSESQLRNSVASRAGPGLRRFDLRELQTIIYTSGTTGRPKGAMLTYGNHFWSAVGSALNLGVRPDDRWLACLPLFHVGGLAILLRSIIYGMPCVLHQSFDAQAVNRAIDEDGVTIASVVATMLERMLDARGDEPYPPSLRCVLLGGGPAPRPLLERCAERGVPVVQTYGLTEAASQVTTLPPEDALRKLGSAGKPLFGTEVSILDEDGRPCGVGQPGEIVVCGPTVAAGYLNQPVRGGSNLLTGDIGYLDDEGYLYVLDRRDDLIISGGENVYPAEIEAVLASHPAVREAGVYGIADARWGQAPAAVVVPRDGVKVGAGELLAFCRERLAGFKVPARIDIESELPRNASGKLLRHALHARFSERTAQP